MRYKLQTIACLLFSALPVFAFAQITGSTPGEYVNNFYKFALLAGGVLAFGAIVYGGIKYTLAAGNPSGQSEGKEWVKGALLGLLLLGGAYLILRTINPELVSLKIPGLPGVAQTYVTQPTVTAALDNCTPTSADQGVCKNCYESQAVTTLKKCLPASLQKSITATFGGQHRCSTDPVKVSCHFGGLNCPDGAHAIDFGKNALAANGLTVPQAAAMLNASSCPYIDTVRCELGSASVSCDTADHIHVNVASGPCGCN
jgi:hypothetical protein